MKFFKNTALLTIFILINNINALTPKEQNEFTAIVTAINNKKTLNRVQINLLDKYKDLLIQKIPNFDISQFKQPTTAQKSLPQQITSVKKTIIEPQKSIPMQVKKEGSISILTPKTASISSKPLETKRPTNEDLIKQLAQTELVMYSRLYYNAEEGLLTLEGIDDIVTTIKKDNPTLDNTQLIDKAYNKAVDILQEIKKQTPLNSQTKNALKNMIKNALGQTTISSFTPTLVELQETLPMKEYYATTPTSFTSTIPSVIENIDKPIEQKKAPQPLSDTLKKFVEHSKKKGTQYYSSKGLIREDWLTYAVKLIVNGTLTADKKEDVIQQLFAMIDILMAAPLRDDKSITDTEYTKIVTKLENQITTFVNKLAINTQYKIKK